MIIVKLTGGLGNQLFQYAFARRIALVNDMKLKLDNITGFEDDPYIRVYSLRHFNIEENLVSRKEIHLLQKKGQFCRKVIRFIERVLRFTQRKVKYNYSFDFLKIYHLCSGCLHIIERSLNFNQNIYNIKLKKNAYLVGYWASEKYFKDIRDIICNEFTVRESLDGINLKIANEIERSNSVSIHIRRLHGISAIGEKVSTKGVNLHGYSSLEYYNIAVKYFLNKSLNFRFFVFADDIDWAKKNINFPTQIAFVSQNHKKEGKDYEDLRLMSLCKHNIIANSTFSWWGAWLNKNPDKIVIAPKIWFRDPAANATIKLEDLYPKEWIII